ncbi:hypothetical protein XIS1_1040009 [Xenorhabdus innexi]|uniref:Uncharacterized protein n=1 Tax=Xenorhabdus innexi TaxID=290109 RepID=A0A1N6MQB5_9GAMM|nr:hypothetical protein XIS1_1040009 [Xenorhabdus innexi]
MAVFKLVDTSRTNFSLLFIPVSVDGILQMLWAEDSWYLFAMAKTSTGLFIRAKDNELRIWLEKS